MTSVPEMEGSKMRKTWVATLVLCIACFAAAAAASAQDVQHKKAKTGAVTAIDDAAKTFTCHWKTTDWTFKTNDKTTYSVGTKAGSWSDLKVGSEVKVTSHDEGSDHIADQVSIKAPKAAAAAPPKS
jgi:hypothetical protein